jgi:hypothetical protein
MEKQHNFTLIDGEFNPSEANSILFTLVNSKINFHQMQSFGITVRTSGDTSFHQKRIKELAQTNVDIRKVIDYATENHLQLRINGTIEINFINEHG